MHAFIETALPELQRDGVLRLHRLRLGGAVAAVLLALHDARSAHFYLSGLAPAFLPFAPGARLLAHAFGQAAAEGLSEVHFLRGQEPYKYAWGAADRPTWRRTLQRSRT
jgi:CelD/BcsL family acetyltransferase involved in cellulose biosynthesis